MYTIYTKNNCSYCVKAKKLLTANNLKYLEKNIEAIEYRSELLSKYPEAKTVPQIFLDNICIGGYENLYLLLNQTI